MISEDEVKKIALLARLYVPESGLKKLTEDLGSILNYIDQLKKTDVSGVEPMCHVHGSTNVYRDDVVERTLSPQDLLQIAPDTSGTYIRVPIIIEQSGE